MSAVTWGRSVGNAERLFLKLVAFGVMVLDHVDAFLYDGALGIHETVGRVVFPLFAMVLAMNLCRIREVSKLYSIAGRMAAVGVLASVPYAFLQGTMLPLNVMFTLGLAVLLLALWRSGLRSLSVVLALVGGLFVDYQWFGLAAILLPLAMARRGASVLSCLIVIAGLLIPVNGSLWALLALPVWAVAAQLEGDAPRLKWLFYVGYPVHLAALAAIAITIQ